MYHRAGYVGAGENAGFPGEQRHLPQIGQRTQLLSPAALRVLPSIIKIWRYPEPRLRPPQRSHGYTMQCQ